MTKTQQEFIDYLKILEAENTRFLDTALKGFYKYWKKYEKDGIKDCMTMAMKKTMAFVGLPVQVQIKEV